MNFKKWFYIASILFVLLNFNIVYSQDDPVNTQNEQKSPANTGTVRLNNPLGSGTTEPEALVANVINSIFGIVGSLALLMFIYGGLTWMTSGGSQDKVKQGRGVILWASIGLAVIFLSYMAVRFVIVALSSS